MWCRRSARAWSDHPRACGANISLITGMSIRNGSSPRVRGKLQRVVEYVGDGRIIPARAGQTSKVSARHSARSDHPRACGANTSSSRLDLLECGSSPRVRGKRADLRPATAATRIIPARAGQTSRRPWHGIRRLDHPRACGANSLALANAASLDGSSPRVRGKLIGGIDVVRLIRIIPARAGQTRSVRPSGSAAADHPRACGANPTGSRSPVSRSGSSPRVRGKRRPHREWAAAVRIIPARAGQTLVLLSAMIVSPDHPRACGANWPGVRFSRSPPGSSPRVRGKQQPGQAHRPQDRIIPARAGQTTERQSA